MDLGVSRILLIVDASIGNEFLTNEDLSSFMMRINENCKRRTEIIVIKNTQVASKKDVFKELFPVKPFPRTSFKKAIKLSTTIVYLTDGKKRERKHSLINRVNRLKNKLVITIRQ